MENMSGKARSRAQAQVRRDVDATQAMLMENEMTIKPQPMAVATRRDPVTLSKIAKMGNPVGDANASSTEPIVKRMTRMKA